MALFRDLWTKLNGADDADTSKLNDDELQIASAALLVHAAKIDGSLEATEMNQISWLLKERFMLSDTELDDLLRDADTKEENAVDLYGFTSVLKRHLDQDGRQHMVEMLWEIVLADRELDRFEENLVWRVAELLGVSSQDRISLKQKVQGQIG